MRVSILIPCFNAAPWVGHALESALAQTWADKEVIVVDDGSTDSSLPVIRNFGDRIRWETGPNRGGNAARNRLLELARGDWLQYLDADDYLLPGKISAQMELISRHPECDVAYAPVTKEFDVNGRVNRELQPIPEPRDPWALLALWYLPQTGAALWRKQTLLDVGGWKNGQPCCQEHELYLRLLMAGKKFCYSGYSGAIYRQWSDQTVCRRNPLEVIRQRLEIKRRAEAFLREHGELTSDRRHAINQSRFQIARSAWRLDHSLAEEIMSIIRSSQPGFKPRRETVSHSYQLALSLLGFRLAETLADWRRPACSPARA